MKNKQLHFFLLEFTLSLIILSVSLVVAFTMFTNAAKMHRETQVLRKLSEELVLNAETLRNPLTEWPTQTFSSTYNAKGELSLTDIRYTIIVTYDTNSAVHQAQLRLTNETGKILIQLKVNALSGQIP